MNKQEYLVELEKALRAAHVQDSADILGEYAEHFEMKLRDGYGEEEIAAKLASPTDIANQFASIKPKSGMDKGSKIILSTGLAFVDVGVGLFFLALYAWVIALGTFSIAAAGLGVMVSIQGTALWNAIPRIIYIYNSSLWNFIPQMPYIGALLMGLALLALAVLSALGTEYCRLYITQLLKIYVRWHKTVLGNGGYASPPLTMHPQILPKKRRTMRSITLIALIVCAVCCVAWYVSMVIATGAIEPWHALHWFE